MRESKYRGKSKYSGEWVYGDLLRHFSATSGYKDIGVFINVHMNPDSNDEYFIDLEVDPDTVGQYIHHNDRKGKEIYEGDKFRVAGSKVYEVRFITEDANEELTSGFGLIGDFEISDDNKYKFLVDKYAIENGEVIGDVYTKEDRVENEIQSDSDVMEIPTERLTLMPDEKNWLSLHEPTKES